MDYDFFRIGDYAEIVSHMFDGTCGTIYYVDFEEKTIWLSAGVTASFSSAWDLTLYPEKESKYHRNEIRKGKSPEIFFKYNKYVIPSDMYLSNRKRKFLWFLRAFYFNYINKKIGKSFEYQLKKIKKWETEEE